MKKLSITLLLTGMLTIVTACEDLLCCLGGPQPPANLGASYYARAVTVEWDLPDHWNGESFLVYSRGPRDGDFILIAEVSNCKSSYCQYLDINIDANSTYEYYVSTFDVETGEEAPSEVVLTNVPDFGAPPAPTFIEAIPLDDANYLRWDEYSRTAEDWHFYRVYVESDGELILVGETDSESFLDSRAENGGTVRYSVAAVDHHGHEGVLSDWAEATPRPDFHGEIIYDYHERRELSGFRFQETEENDPIVDGDSRLRHFRLEVGSEAWFMVPGPGTAIFPTPFRTTALRCGPGSDANCVDVRRAPTSGYVSDAMPLETQTSYVLRVTGDDGERHYGVIRPDMLGFTESNEPVVIFNWAFQTQPNNVGLMVAR
ncbi:MAG: hypothetical protein J4G12_06960 [Gemmatimonadetes bacterium]|nr:hypothetical protein [Gemmatimonadota bacterium]